MTGFFLWHKKRNTLEPGVDRVPVLSGKSKMDASVVVVVVVGASLYSSLHVMAT